MKNPITRFREWRSARMAESAAANRRQVENEKYEKGVGYRRYADALKEIRNYPDTVKGQPVLNGVYKLMGGNPFKVELLHRMNQIDPDSFDANEWKRKGPVQYTFDKVYGNNNTKVK